MHKQDELHWFAEALGLDDYFCEINVLPPGDPSCPSGMWTTRVTSHIALSEVPELVTAQRIKDACRLAHLCQCSNVFGKTRAPKSSTSKKKL